VRVFATPSKLSLIKISGSSSLRNEEIGAIINFFKPKDLGRCEPSQGLEASNGTGPEDKGLPNPRIWVDQLGMKRKFREMVPETRD